ncbi:hypothetical protein [Nocardia flavorosea]|uniref:WXG100 family type VII secretion target n=1 Tax=Nocardia flavorosea TaxID=53429 RepID=A0A846YKR2_9NOCA|nr:hypothetical protein [Nocardia flavorosea]NKY58351.1 hypothetical protein [Nocardia flavorosea]
MTMDYQGSIGAQLVEEMNEYYKALNTHHDNFISAKNELINVAWEDNSSSEAFAAKAHELELAMDDTHLKLAKLRDAIEAAFGNAGAADKMVYNSF